MKTELSIRDAVRKLIGKEKFTSISALVKSTNPDNGLASVLIEEFDLELDARLTAFEMSGYESGLIVIPEEGSYVLLTRIESSDEFMVSGFTKVKEIRLGGDKFSLVKGEELKNQLTEVKSAIETIKNALINSAVVTGDGGAAYKASITTAIANINSGNFSNILNQNVKHG